jgi:transaldolase
MKPLIFLDSGSARDTVRIQQILPNLAGQTTNPSLVARSPEVQELLGAGTIKLSRDQLLQTYHRTIESIQSVIPEGDISIEVYADKDSIPDELYQQGIDMASWTKGARIKLPITKSGIIAAQMLAQKGIRINMTLCFSVEQALAVSQALRDIESVDVVISPFVGRLGDKGFDGISLLSEMRRVYTESNSPIRILAASIRNCEHISRASEFADIMTLPADVITAWVADNNQESHTAKTGEPIVYSGDVDANWEQYDISHELTEIGLAKFASDWNGLLG